jgi:hypothetical protein
MLDHPSCKLLRCINLNAVQQVHRDVACADVVNGCAGCSLLHISLLMMPVCMKQGCISSTRSSSSASAASGLGDGSELPQCIYGTSQLNAVLWLLQNIRSGLAFSALFNLCLNRWLGTFGAALWPGLSGAVVVMTAENICMVAAAKLGLTS